MKNNNNFLSLLCDYLNTYLPLMKGISPNTILSYKSTFRLFVKFMYEKKGISADHIKFVDLDYETLSDFFNWIEEDRQCSASTKNQRLSAMMSFSKYAQNRDIDAACSFRNALLKIPMKKQQHKKRSVFTRDEISIFLSIPDNKTAIGQRDRVLLSVMYASGARGQEICDLKVRNIHFNDKGAILDITGKGEKTRRVSIPVQCASLLKQYMEYKHICSKLDNYVFSSQTHNQMSVAGIEALFKKYLRKAKEENPDLFNENNYSPHTLRHSCASHMLESGVPIIVIKNFLGHASIQTTEIYAEISQETVDKKLLEWNKQWHFDLNDNDTSENAKEIIPDFLK